MRTALFAADVDNPTPVCNRTLKTILESGIKSVSRKTGITGVIGSAFAVRLAGGASLTIKVERRSAYLGIRTYKEKTDYYGHYR